MLTTTAPEAIEPPVAVLLLLFCTAPVAIELLPLFFTEPPWLNEPLETLPTVPLVFTLLTFTFELLPLSLIDCC